MDIFFILTIVVFIILLLAAIAAWLCKLNARHKEVLVDNAVDTVFSIVSDHITSATLQYKTGPWYLVVYILETNYPLWISNNNIRSVHPDFQNCKLIIKQFNGEDMVIENVVSYGLCSANNMSNYDM